MILVFIVFLIIFGICIFFLFDKWSCMVLKLRIWEIEGIDIYFRKCSNFGLVRCILYIFGGFSICFGFIIEVCFLVVLILDCVSDGISWRSFFFVKLFVNNDKICSWVFLFVVIWYVFINCCVVLFVVLFLFVEDGLSFERMVFFCFGVMMDRIIIIVFLVLLM